MVNNNELIKCAVSYKTSDGKQYVLRHVSLSPSLQTSINRSVKRSIFIIEYGKMVESFINNNRSTVNVSDADEIIVYTVCGTPPPVIDEVIFSFKLSEYYKEKECFIDRVDYDPT